MPLIVGDAVALALFAPLGLLSHHEGITLAGLGRNAGPILLGWFTVAAAAGVYTAGGPRRTMIAWLLGITGGVTLRGLLLGRAPGTSQVTFLVVTLAVTGTLLGVWRVLWTRRLRASMRMGS